MERDEEGKMMGNPYKIKKGVSTDHVALELLEKEGFPKEIIETARDTYSKIEKVRFF